MEESRSVTLQDVAERAGVSVMTVSLALRGGAGAKRMSVATRERVLDAAKALRYQPNARARAFRLGRTNVIGLYAGYGYINVRSPFFTEIVSGLQEGCEQARKDLLLHGVFHGSSPEDLYAELADGRIDGLVVSMPRSPLAERLVNAGLPVVAVSDNIPGMPSVVVDDAGGLRMLVQHLAELGHRRLRFVMSPAQPVSALERRRAFFETTAEFGIVADEDVLADGEAAESCLDRALSKGVTAIVGWNDIVTRELLAAAMVNKISVPGQIALTGFDGCPTPFPDPFPLTTVVAPWSEVARTAVHLLDALIAGREVPAETILTVRFHRGATT